MFPIRIYRKQEMPLGTRLLRVGCRGRDVLSLQRELKAAGYLGDADGRYGYVTEAAVRKLQARSKLPSDGVAGAATLRALRVLREGLGVVHHRVRPGETEAQVAAALGVTVEALRRHNVLRRREEVTAGALLAVPERIVLLWANEDPPPVIARSALLGPLIRLEEPNLAGAASAGGRIPVLVSDLDAWNRFLRRPKEWTAAAAIIRRLGRERDWRRWAIDLPAPLWWHRRRVLGMLSALKEGSGAAPVPIVRWPFQNEPPPDIAALARLGDYLILDPGPLIFAARSCAHLLRWVSEAVEIRRVILAAGAGGLLRGRDGACRLLSVRAAKITAASARTRLAWDEEARILRAAYRIENESWELLLMEERVLRDRVRLGDRFGVAGLLLGGFDGLRLPAAGVWPGEFAVLDNFLSARHIDYRG